MHDITNLLNDKVEFYEYFLENLYALVFSTNQNDELIYMNSFAEVFFNKKLEHINETGWSSFVKDLLHPDDIKSFNEDTNGLFKKKKNKYFSVYRFKGENHNWRSVLITGATSLWDKDENPIETSHLAINVSEKFDGLEHIESIMKENANLKNQLKLSELSKREIEILALIPRGLSNAMIADELYVSIETIKTHRKNIMKKLNVNNVAEMVEIAVEYGLY